MTTPQEVSLADVGKALAMFQRMSVPVLGLVENMTAFVCPHCGEVTEIFGRGGGERFAAEHDLEYLGGIPLDITVRQGGDVGVPAVAQREPGPAAPRDDLDRPGRGRADERPGRPGGRPAGADDLLKQGPHSGPRRLDWAAPAAEEPVVQCPSCGAQTPRRARFCDQCGAQLAPRRAARRR